MNKVMKKAVTAELALRQKLTTIQGSFFARLKDERGDVPGWVLVVLMTTGLVTAIWTIAAPRLTAILKNSLDSMNGIRQLNPQNRFRLHLAREDGNVESALVIIPLLILFLIGAQVIAATNLRNADLAMAQGDAAARAISQEFQVGDDVLEIGGRVEKIRVLVTHRSHSIPQLVPGLVELLGGNPVTDVVGIAVIEPSSS